MSEVFNEAGGDVVGWRARPAEVPAAIRSDAVSCQRPCQHGNGPVSERSAMVDAMNGSAITASGLRKAYKDKIVLDGIDLDVRTGTVFALLGPNGAGKTTTVNVLTTLLTPDAGKVVVAGHDVAARCARAARSLQRNIAFARSVIASISANYLPECTSSS
ncbi:ATP-binding cassette domain-containing protein [Nonomuraea sp. M3C6]|uniref:ATP-binding cassette domain-containing protein n=1 Tax=Nonomuraea marmarensis TaxID=3351344 RepID=A0ABW7AL20_9ACTN